MSTLEVISTIDSFFLLERSVYIYKKSNLGASTFTKPSSSIPLLFSLSHLKHPGKKTPSMGSLWKVERVRQASSGTSESRNDVVMSYLGFQIWSLKQNFNNIWLGAQYMLYKKHLRWLYFKSEENEELLGTALPGFRTYKPLWLRLSERPWDHKPLRRQSLSPWQEHRLCPTYFTLLGPQCRTS